MNTRPTRRRFLALAGATAASASLLNRSLGLTGLRLDTNPTEPAKAAARAVTAFAADLQQHLASEKDTLFVSPFSISAALTMTSAGARGDTLKEMEKVLHLPKNPHPAFGDLLAHLNGATTPGKRGYQLSIANAIWAMKGFPWHPEFLTLTQKHYGSGIQLIDFSDTDAARQMINEWVEKETKEKIKDLIPPGVITALTRMVLANAIYFKGDWQTKFDKKLTHDALFTRDDGTKATVPLMTQSGEFGYGEFTLDVRRSGEKVQVLELPYTGKELSMLVFLPEDPTGVQRLPQGLTAENLAKPELRPQRVRVFLPRFKAESALSLKPVLIKMGMPTAFSDQSDFTGMSPKGKDLVISHVLHKAFVDVNEEGTEAAAATAVVVKERSAPRETVFRADRPFVFAIRDTATGAVLFLGRYSGPKGS
jgi:serpin B